MYACHPLLCATQVVSSSGARKVSVRPLTIGWILLSPSWRLSVSHTRPHTSSFSVICLFTWTLSFFDPHLIPLISTHSYWSRTKGSYVCLRSKTKCMDAGCGVCWYPAVLALSIMGPLNNVNVAGHTSRVFCITFYAHNILGYNIKFRMLFFINWNDLF